MKVELTFCTAAPPQTRVTLLAAGRRLLQLLTLCSPPPPHPPMSQASRPMRIVSSGGEARLHLKKYYFCAPSPPPLPFVHFCKGRRGQVSFGVTSRPAQAGPEAGGFLSYAASLPLGRRTAHLSGQQVAVAGCQRAGGRLARTIALLLPAGGGGCYNIHIPPRHSPSYCDL